MSKAQILKSFSVDDATMSGNVCSGWPSVTGILDSYGDCIFFNAFHDALPRFLKRGSILTDHDWSIKTAVGFPTVCEERGNKLYGEFVFHTDEQSQVAKTKVAERIAANKTVGLSVGFSMDAADYVAFKNGKELLAYAKKNGYDMKLFDVAGLSACTDACWGIIRVSDLWEYSLTPFPANPEAMAIQIKSAKKINIHLSAREATGNETRGNMKIKSICGARGLDLAARDKAWDAAGAIKRVKAYAGIQGEYGEPNEKFAKAFVVCDGADDEFGSYKLPFADVSGDKLVAVPKAIQAIAGVLDGSRGGVELSDKDRAAAKSFVEAYYSKMADEFDDDEIKVPWAESDYDKASDPVPMFKGQFLGNYVEMAMCMGAVNQANYALLSTYRDALSGYGDWKDIEPDDANSRLGMCHDEHKDLCMSIHKAVASGNGAETPDEAVESAKRMEIAILSAGGLGSGLAFEKHAEVAADATRLFVERASERAAKRMREKRDVSASNRSTMQRLRDQTAKNLVDLDGLIANTEPKGAAKASELRDLELAQLRLRQAHFVRASV